VAFKLLYLWLRVPCFGAVRSPPRNAQHRERPPQGFGTDGAVEPGTRREPALCGRVAIDTRCQSDYSFVNVPGLTLTRLAISMATVEFLKTKAIWSGCLSGALLLILLTNPAISRAQAAAEAAGASAVSGGMGAAVSKSFPASLPAALPGPAVDPRLGYVAPSASGPPADVVNRKALEQRAGKGAAKLLLQSVPTAAAVFINGMFVGRAPLLLLVAPGSYKVAMRGPRDEFGERAVTVATSETQQVVLPLTQRYPVTVSATPKRAAPSSVLTTSGGVAGPVSSAGPDLQAKAAAGAAATALAAGEKK